MERADGDGRERGRGERGEVDGREEREDRREGEGRQRVEMREE